MIAFSCEMDNGFSPPALKIRAKIWMQKSTKDMSSVWIYKYPCQPLNLDIKSRSTTGDKTDTRGWCNNFKEWHVYLIKTIRGKRCSQNTGISLYLLLSLLLFFSTNTYTLRDSWQSIDIRGDEVGVLRKHKHAGERRGKVTSEAYHSCRREWGEEERKRPFTLFYDLWLIFSSVYMNCWAGVWTVAMLLSGLQNRESSIAAQLPIDTDWGDVSGGKRSLYLSIKKARGAPTHTEAHMRVCARVNPHRHTLSRTGCLEDHRAACLTLGEQGRFSVQIKEAWERCCLEVDKPPSETHFCVSHTHTHSPVS